MQKDSTVSEKIISEPLQISSVSPHLSVASDENKSACDDAEGEHPNISEENEPTTCSEDIEDQSCVRANETPIVSDIGLDMGVDISDLPYADDALRVNSMINEEKRFECPSCYKKFSQEPQLKRHVKLHNVLQHHDCEICGKRFNQKTYLKAHMNTVHALVKPVLSKIYSCSVCSKRFGRTSHLRRHMKMHSEGKKFSCLICGKCFSQNCNLKCHMKIHLGQDSSALESGLIKKYVNDETKAECFQCELCGKSFQQVSSLKAHINTVHVDSKIFEKCFECCFCHKQFGRNSHLKRHLKLHVGGVTFTCDLCGRGFKQNGNLKAHIRMVHLKERSFQCTYCGKMFLQKSNLNTHIRTHTGEKPYECTLCGKDFTQGNQLKYHMRSHLGERPYSCTFCGKKFTNNRSCQRHMKTHTGEKSFNCNFCSKSFYQPNQLNTHMRTHTGEKPFDCSVCGKEFTNKRGRDKHFMAHSDAEKLVAESEDYEIDDHYSDEEETNDSEGMIPTDDIKEEIDVVIKEEPEIYDESVDYELTDGNEVASSDVSAIDPLENTDFSGQDESIHLSSRSSSPGGSLDDPEAILRNVTTHSGQDAIAPLDEAETNCQREVSPIRDELGCRIDAIHSVNEAIRNMTEKKTDGEIDDNLAVPLRSFRKSDNKETS